MKVMFVNPPREGFFLITERQVPIGIYYLADSCRRNGFDVKVVDMLSGEITPRTLPPDSLSPEQRERLRTNPIFGDYVRYGMEDERLLEIIALDPPDVICVSVMFSCFHDAAERLTRKIRDRFPRITIIAGGAHVTANCEDVLRNDAVDYCLQYEGEKTLPELLRRVGRREPADDVEGVAFRRGDTVVINRRHSWIADLDEVRPAYDLIPPEARGGAITVITSRGCPYACEFCTVHLSMGRAYRTRSVKDVVDEFETYSKMGFARFNVEDDNFTFDLDRAKAILRGVAERNIRCDICFPNGIAVQNLDRECIRLMAAAGVKKLFLGLETTADRLLTSLKKKHTSLRQIREAVRLCRDRGIGAGASLIIGFPSQTLEEILTDILTLIRLDIPIYAVNPLYPLPGTGMYDECVKMGILTGKEDCIFLGSDNFVIRNDSFSREDLYYLWAGVKGYTRWGFRGAGYLAFDSTGTDEALSLIAEAFGGKAENGALTVSSRKVNADLISARYRVFSDMTRCFAYLLSGVWLTCAVEEGDEVTLRCAPAGGDAPRALTVLKKTARAKS